MDAGWETIFGFLDTVADTYIYYILLNHLLYSIIYYIYIYLILQTVDKM